MKKLALFMVSTIILATLLMTLTSCSTNKDPINEDQPLVDLHTEVEQNEDKVIYKSIKADWPVYEDLEDLVKAGNVILLGKVTDISFQVLDDRTGQAPSEETEEVDRNLYTIYDIDVITSYKGDSFEPIKIRALGGLENLYIKEQLKALEEETKKLITFVKGRPNITIDETYLFVLSQYEETMPTLVNMEQGVYDTRDPHKKDWYSFFSAKDIISSFGEDKWDEFNKANTLNSNEKAYDMEKIDSALIKGNLTFAFDIFKSLNMEDMEESIFISPLSISQALTMAYNGAETTTKEGIEKTLGLSGLDRTIVNESFSNLINYLEQIDDKIKLNIGNSVWIRDGEEIKDEFIQANKDNFNAEVKSLDISDDKAVEIINNWIDNATNGKITKMLEPPISEDILMYLINAIYFKGEWTEQFDPELTYHDNFYAHDGEVQTANMMRKSKGSVEFTSSEKYKAVRLPYGNGKTSMYIILPSEGTDINDFISNMTIENWKGIKKSVIDRDDIVFRIPRFKLEYGTKSLKETLISLGMEEAFSDNADFTGIREQVAISDVMHKALIEVNEEGSEAAAATVVEMKDLAAAEPITF
ncbi:MAG: hypothetical protein GX915_01565, partial [Clostridiales bacterium]|nr:hypothetical protein [Clostridiales bacterium]